MRRTVPQMIAANKRMSTVYSAAMIVLLSILGGVITLAWIGEPFSGMIVLALVGLIVALVAAANGPSIVLKMSNTRNATPHELQVLNNVTEEMAIAAGIPKPKVFLIDDPTPNAFATGKNPQNGIVVVTTGLMEKLDRDQLQAVVAHEIAHIKHNDVRLMTTLAIVAGLIPLISHIFIRGTMFGAGGNRSSSSSSGGGGGGAIILLVGLVFMILAPIFSKMLELAVSRQREYMADAGAAQFTRNPTALAEALARITRDPGKMREANPAIEHMYIINPLHKRQRASSLFATHPPTEERIKRLQSMAGARRTGLLMDSLDPIPRDFQSARPTPPPKNP